MFWIKRIFRQHQSGVIVIPRQFMQYAGWKPGDHLRLQQSLDGKSITVSKLQLEKGHAKKSGAHRSRKARKRQV